VVHLTGVERVTALGIGVHRGGGKKGEDPMGVLIEVEIGWRDDG
jgi:hypothetical protein